MNKQVILEKRPFGLPTEETWSLRESDLQPLGDGEIRIRNQYVSLDPAMRGWISDARSYIAPVQVGDVMRAGTVGRVEASNHPSFAEGDFVTGWGGVQQYVQTDGKGWYRVDAQAASLSHYIGILGMPGMTAYFGLLEVGRPQSGETVVVSGAAGAVGSVVGQIARIKDCRVIGLAGSAEKCAYLTETLGFDAAINYKEEDIRRGLRKHCPDGIDVYFDNVGGDTLDTVLTRINRRARIVVCGAISQYNNTQPIQGPSNYLAILVQRARMEGFIVMDYASEYPRAMREMATWLSAGQLQTKEHIETGIEHFHATFLRLFSGDKMGKLILKI